MWVLEYTKMHKGSFIELSAGEEKNGKLIVNAAYVVHKTPGAGLLEKVYEVFFDISCLKRAVA